MSEISDPNRPFSILVLNGGGIRGYTSLCVLEELEDEVKRALVRAGEADRYSESLKPCNIFNFIAGVSTGAIIAIMLGRLEMSIEECKVAYQQLSQKVFSDSTIRTTTRFFKTIIRRKDVDILAYRYSRKSLETVIHQFLEAQALDPNIPLVPRQEEDIGRRCNVLIPIIEITENENVLILQTDPVGNSNERHWTIQQAILAATAAPTYFPAYQHPSGGAFIDAAFRGYNNPSVLIYSKIKEVSGHRMEALFLDVGTGDHGPLPIRKCRKHRAMISWAIRGLTDTKPPVSEIENKCNLGRNEKIYYRLDVQYPATWKFVQTHHYKMIPQIKTHVAKSVLRDDLRSIIEEASKRMVELIRGEYNNKGDFETIQDRICDPCNRADPKAAVCFFNPLNEEFFRDQVTCPSMMPYTSQNLPEYFDKFKSASETITKWYPNGRDCTMAHMETAIHDLREVLRMLQSKFKEARHDQSILSEFILTIFKLSIAHGLAGATEEKTRMKNIIKASTAIMLGRKHHYPNFIDPCQWFTIKRNERHQ